MKIIVPNAPAARPRFNENRADPSEALAWLAGYVSTVQKVRV